MVLKYFKSLHWPSGDASTYTLLPTSGSQHSRDSSIEVDSAEPLSEKAVVVAYRESHFRVDPRIISDATIGLSDGLTVPFALTAGLSALGDTRLVIYGGLAELIAGGISMGLGGYLGAISEAQAYKATFSETRNTVSQDPESTRDLVTSTFKDLGFSDDLLELMAAQLSTSQTNTENFLMRFHHQLSGSAIESNRAYVSALTIALGYFVGGLIPLTPYFIFETNQVALLWSIAVMAVSLFAFGYVKTFLVGEINKLVCAKAGVQMVVLGGIAAAAAMGCVKAIGGS